MKHKTWHQTMMTLCSAVLLGGITFSAPMLADEIKQSPSQQKESRMLTILHTNDIHGHLTPWTGWEGELINQTVGGLDRLAARVSDIRTEVGAERVLLLDAGDAIGDTLVAAATEGRAIIETLNTMRYDAMVVGNHEPDFTAETLRQRIAEALFPVLAANIVHSKDQQLFTVPYLIREVNGVRLGILGLAYPNTPLTSARKNVAELQFRDAVETAREYVPQMRREGADLIIALTHLGLGTDKILAEKVAGIDVIVGGHSHNRMKKALRVGDTLIVQAGAHGSDLGRLDLTVAQGRIVSHRRTLLPIINTHHDSAVAEVIQRYTASYDQKMQSRVGHTAHAIVRAQTLAGQNPEKRDAESPADALFADAIREMTGTDLAFLPGVGYGVAIQPGEITAGALRNLIPHDSAIWSMKLTGTQIRAVLEQSIENISAKDPAKKVGGMIQVSGLTFSYNPNGQAGPRVREIMVEGKPLALHQHYVVAVNALLAQGGHNYAAFTQGTERHERGQEYEMIRAWIKKRGEITVPSTNRIIKLEEAND